jgi:hypothetical protein
MAAEVYTGPSSKVPGAKPERRQNTNSNPFKKDAAIICQPKTITAHIISSQAIPYLVSKPKTRFFRYFSLGNGTAPFLIFFFSLFHLSNRKWK